MSFHFPEAKAQTSPIQADATETWGNLCVGLMLSPPELKPGVFRYRFSLIDSYQLFSVFHIFTYRHKSYTIYLIAFIYRLFWILFCLDCLLLKMLRSARRPDWLLHFSSVKRTEACFSTSARRCSYEDTIGNLKIGSHTRVIFQGFTGELFILSLPISAFMRLNHVQVNK
jgi:hypothetical protein